MIASDLSYLDAPEMRAAQGLFQDAVFDRLTGDWMRAPLDLDAVQVQQLLAILARWIAHADAREGEGDIRLMQARLPLRRLATACGVLPRNLLGYALGMDETFDLFALSVEQREKLALLGDASFYRGFTLAQWAQQEPRLALLFAASAVDDAALEVAPRSPEESWPVNSPTPEKPTSILLPSSTMVSGPPPS